jgi:predicted enzyme related to lactoylglutathione lyase
VTTRDRAPRGAPCWTDLWTSDVEGSQRFYADLFGWEAGEPAPEFGGYFMFTRQGVPVAGAMGPMDGAPPSNRWSVYLATDDIAKSLEAAESLAGQVVSAAMPVADLGIQAVITDPTGAHVGLWQPGTFAGFTVLDEPGTPDWFELLTRDHATAVSFYTSVFRCSSKTVSDTDEFRYTMLTDADGGAEVAGIMDARSFLSAEVPSNWSVYWEVEDTDATAARARSLGGSVVMEPESTPYGRLATVADPAGAVFKLRAVDAAN